MIYHGGYDLDDLEPTVDRITSALGTETDRFDSIAVAGMSGVVVGVPVSMRLRVPLVIIRKDSDSCHDVNRIIGEDRLGERYLFLDDFISTGKTLMHVRKVIEETSDHLSVRAHYAGSYLYDGDLLTWDGDGVAGCGVASADELRAFKAKIGRVKSDPLMLGCELAYDASALLPVRAGNPVRGT